MFRNTPNLILTNPNHPQHYGTQSASRPTPTNSEPMSVTPPALRSHLACPSDSQNDLMNPGLNTNHLPGHPSPYPHLGLKPDLSPHRNPNSVHHIVIAPHCCSLPDPESVILVCTLDSFALTSLYPTTLYYNSSI